MGRFTLRLPQTLHQELEQRAELEGVSLNQYIVYSLTRQVSSSYSVQVLPEFVIDQQKEKFQHLLEALGQPRTNIVHSFLDEREATEDDALPDDIKRRIEEKLAKEKGK